MDDVIFAHNGHYVLQRCRWEQLASLGTGLGLTAVAESARRAVVKVVMCSRGG